jgi:hypothetical protein
MKRSSEMLAVTVGKKNAGDGVRVVLMGGGRTRW